MKQAVKDPLGAALVLLTDGTVWAAGAEPLGNGKAAYSPTFVQVTALTGSERDRVRHGACRERGQHVLCAARRRHRLGLGVRRPTASWVTGARPTARGPSR